MVFFNRTGINGLRLVGLMRLVFPVAPLYAATLGRKFAYRLLYIAVICYGIGFFRKPYITRAILRSGELQTQEKAAAIQQTLSNLDIRLNDFPENYFVVISAHSPSGREEDLAEKEKIAFELNAQINSKLQISANYYSDIKLLFLGERQIFDLLSANRTVVQLYEKEGGLNDTSSIYIFAREADGTERLLSTLPFKPDLQSILRIISKHRARKFASSLQF